MMRVVAVLLALAGPVWAVEPDEMLADPGLEARANALDHAIRCVQCRSESIASSNADWARDARLLVRDLISDGASDDVVLAFFVERYGDVVLMRPRAEGINLVLWLAAPAMFLTAAGMAAGYLRRRSRAAPAAAELSAEEEARVAELLDR